MSISKEDVKYIAALSRIHVPAEKLEGLTKNLADIVTYVEALQSLNVDNIKPTTHAVPVGDVFRPDVVKPSLSNQGPFKVPLVIE